MHFIQGNNRKQTLLFPTTMEDAIDADNEVRVIDLFADSLKLQDFDFKIKVTSEGRPAYHPTDLLKLFIYGYLNRIRSSRKLEKECRRNIELMWLLKGMVPDHNFSSASIYNILDGCVPSYQALSAFHRYLPCGSNSPSLVEQALALVLFRQKILSWFSW